MNECVVKFLYILVTFSNKHFTFKEEIHEQGHDAAVEEASWSNGKNPNDSVQHSQLSHGHLKPRYAAKR